MKFLTLERKIRITMKYSSKVSAVNINSNKLQVVNEQRRPKCI